MNHHWRIQPASALLLLSLTAACEAGAPLSHATDTTDTGGQAPPGMVFIQPTLECRDPIAGEPPGASDGDQVCTWQGLTGATEPGRRFEDYASCEAVQTNRPYYPLPPDEAASLSDPRMDDPAYLGELDWVRGEIEATGCWCCHSDAAPLGPSNWNTDALGNWSATFHDRGLALMAGWIDVSALGAYTAADNNGFERKYGALSTDSERMRAFFEGELAHRGRSPDEFADLPPEGGPLVDQLLYEPGPCEAGEGVEASGEIHWLGGPARYVYVLEADSVSPTIPPNLDLPDGTRWRIDVPHDGDPVPTGSVRYGELPPGLTQRVPAQGEPAPLVAGADYYLYVSQDVARPITRCLFTY